MAKWSAVRWRRLWSQPLVSSTPPRSVNRWVIGFSLIQILLALFRRPAARRIGAAPALDRAGAAVSSAAGRRELRSSLQGHPARLDLVHRHLVDSLAGA